MPAMYQQIERSFTTEEVLGILHNPDWSRVIREPPVKPRGGQVFLYHYTEESKKDDWRCDQYHFKHDGLRKQPRTNPKFYKNFFILRTNHSNAKGDKRFKKHAYILIGDHKNLVLFQYLGDESVAQDLPHGNSKNASLLYTRLCPSVIEAIKDITVPSREVLQTLEEQARSSAVPEVHKPRSLLQISNTRSRVKRRSRTGKKKTRRKKKKKKEDPGTKHDTVVSPCLASTYLPERISAGPSAEADVILSPDPMSPQTRLAALAQLCENICQENMVRTSNEEAQNLDSLVIDKGDVPVEAIDAEPSVQTGDDESGINNMSNPNTDIELEVTDTSLVFEVGRTLCIPLANEDRDSNRLAETHKVCDIIQDSGISSSNMLVSDVQNSIDSDTNHTGHGGLGTGHTPVCSLPSTAAAPNTLEHHIEVMDSNQLHRILALVKETLQVVSHGTQTCLSSNTKVTSTAFVYVSESNGDVSTLQQEGPCAVLQQGTSLPHTAGSLIAQVSSTWAADFQSIKQSLPRLNSLGSVIQTHLELLDLIAAVIVGAYRTSTDCLSFVETLKNYPSHLERNLSRQLPTDVDKGTKYRIGNYTISGTDILRLDGNSWLDDSVIHAFLHLLKKQYTEERQRDVKILECFQYKLWEKGNYSEWLYEKDQFSTFDWILMPICFNNHWVLLAANVSNRTVCIINSQTSSNLSPQVTQHWMKFIQCRSWTTGEELSVWRPLQQPVFQQTDGSSCGVFVLMAAEALVAGIPPAIMRTCHVAMYRHYVKQRLVSAAEVVQTATMEDVAIEGMDGAKPIDMVDISSERHINHSQGCEQEDLTVPTDEALQITTEAMNSTEVMTDAALPCDHRPGNAQADLDEGQSEDEESGKSGFGNIDLSADKKHADDCKETITEEEEMMDASTEHVSDEECDEHATLGKPNTSVLLNCTPLTALAQCEAIYRNERLHFTALTLLCMEKGRMQLSDLTEVSESLQSHIEWSCQLSGVEELSPVHAKTCLQALNTTLLKIEDDVVQFRQEETLSHIKDILTNTSVEYMAKVDLEFIYLHVKLHHTDAPMDEEHVFPLSLDRARQKDLASRFAQEIIKHNFAFTLSHQVTGKHTFCVQVARLIKQYMQTGSMTELFASPDIKHGGNFLNWLCFGKNAELYKVLSMYILEDVKEECLIYCCVSGNLDVLQLLLEDMDIKDVLSLKPKVQVVQGIHSCGIKTQSLATHFLPPLHLSSYYGNTDIVTCLLQLGCDINVQLPDEFDGREGPVPPGSTPAAAAASGGHTAVLQCLIDHHAAMNLVDCNNNSLLHLACKGGHTDAVMLLINECDKSARNIDGNTPLHLACEERKLRVVEVLLKTNVDVTLLNYQAFTPFDIICQKGYLDIAILVLNATSYPLPHDGNNTPLHAACRGGYTELVKILLRYDANRSVCNNTSRMNCCFESSRPLMFSMSGNDVKQTPLFEACEKGHIDIVRLLIEKGADVSAAGNGNTPLHWACKNGHIDIVRLLIEKGADVSAAGNGNTALHWACENGHVHIVRLLIEKGADVSAAGNGYTPLHWACKNGHIDIVRLLIEKGADVSASAAAADDDDGGYTALHWACENGHVHIVRLLIEKGADVSAAGNGNTALHWACKNGHIDIVRLLIEKGADVSAAGNGNTALHWACENGHVHIVRLLIEKGADVSAAGNGYTPLHWACKNGHIDIVRLLIEKGADVSAAGNGYTALHWACENGHIFIVRLLIEKGADVSAAAATAAVDDGYTALHWACENGHIDIVRLLIEKGADVSAASCYGYTPLHWACENGHVHIVRLLIEKGADLSAAAADDDDGYTPLHWACDNGHIDIVRLLIEKGADVSAASCYGYTPLNSACKNGHIDMVRLLIEKGADVSAASCYGSTSLHWACENGHIEIVRLLIEKGADVSAAAIVDDGYTALHWACQNCDIDIVRLLIEKGADVSATNGDGNTPISLACKNGHVHIVRLLIEKGANVSAAAAAAADDGYTALHWASDNGHMEIVRLLIEKGADVSAAWNGNTPLHWACKNGHIHIVRLLIEKGADLSAAAATAADDDGYTALHWACKNGHIDIVRLLIEKGADVSAASCYGSTPLHSACENGHIDIVRLLIEKGADVSATNGNGDTPLSLACKNGHIDIVKLFEQDIVMAVGKCNCALTALVLKKTIMDFVNISTERNKPYAISCDTILQKCLKTNICVIYSISNMLSILKQYQDKMVLVKLLTSLCNCEIIKNLLIKLKVTNFKDILHYALLQKAVAKGDAHCVYFLTRVYALRSFSDNQLLNMMVEAVQNKHFTVFQMLHDVPHVHDSSDQLVFHACEHGQVQVCNVLLSCGSCHSGRCLIAAFKVRNVVLVELLLKCDVDVNAYDGEGNSSLHLACELGDDNIVKLLIEKGQSVHETNAQMETPLFAASRHGHVAVVKLVLSHGADITKIDIEGNSVLHCACLSGEVDLLQFFIQHISLKTKHVLGQGGPVSLSRVLYFSNKNGESLLHVVCRKNHNRAVEILLQNKMSMYARDNKGNTPVSMTEKQKSLFVVLCNFSCELQEKDSTGNTLLHIACDRGYIECVDVLCRRGANVSASNNELEYAVHKAAQSGRVEIMDILLAHEADINVTDIEKQTPLHLACAENNLEIVEILIRNKAGVNVCDKHHVTPLHLACRDGFTDIAAVLLKAFADDGVVSENNVTPLVCACEGGHINCVKLLLRAGVNVNVTGHRGNTPLHRASAQGHESVVKVLLSCGADPLQGNINGKLPLHHAVLWGHLGIVKVLIDKCKSYLKESSNMLLLLESVCSRGYVEILKCLMEFFDQFLMPPKNMFHLIKTSIISNHSELLTILEGKGCNIQQRDDRGWSILQVVCESEGIDQTSLDKVLELGFDLREITEHGESLLHIACKMDNIETVKHLIEKGANVHSKDNSGDTVLHVACAHGYFDTATVLIKKGLSINEKNLKGLTSLDIAIANKHYGVTCLYDPYYALSNSLPRISMMSLHHICLDKKIQLLYNSEIVDFEVDSDGNSALHISCLEDSDEIVQLLVIAGAWLNLRNNLGEAPVHVACRGTLSCLKAMTDAVVNRDLLKTVVTSRDRNNNTPLHIVAHERKFEHLCLLLEKGADVNLANNFDQTALHIACYVGDANIVLKLLNARANILAKDKCGNTPLHIICTEGNLSLLRLINHNEAVIATRNYEGRTPLHEAVNRGYHAMILYMMTEYWHFTQSDLTEEGLQHFIIRMGREDFTKLLMGETICPDSEGNTPLHHAAETKSLVIVKTLMRRGYSCQATNELGETPLFNACLKGSATIVELFLKEGSPPCITNDNNMTPLHVACQTGHVDIVVLFFDYDPDLGARTNLGQTVLHLACMSGSADVVEALLKARSDINARDNNLDTPLHMAAMHGKIDSIILLAKWGARDVQCNQQGDLALHHACREGRSDAVKTLLNIDSDASVLNHQGVSPVMLACDRDCVSILELLLQRLLVEVQIESVQPTDDSVHEKYVTNLNYCLYCACKHNYLGILQLLIKYNVDINHTFTDTELKLINRQSIEELSQSENEHRTLQPTALHIACFRGHTTCVETLMRSGAHSESKTSSGDTPLHVACIHGHDDTVALLLNGGVSASPVSDNGTTPLHYACRGGFEVVVSRLLAAGADPDAEDGDGKTPLAVSRGRGVAGMFLKSHGSSRKRGKDTSQAAELPPQKVSKE